MAWVLVPASLVAVLQGVAWLGPRAGEPRPVRGATLACAGVLGLGLTLLHVCVPDFFGG